MTAPPEGWVIPPDPYAKTRELPGQVIRERIGLVLPSQVAAAFNINEETLASWRSNESGPPYIKLGKSVFYRLSDVEDWIVMRPIEFKTRPKSSPTKPEPQPADASPQPA